jgi:hypothetical protein
MKSMKSITTAGLCLVAMLVLSMALAASAMATNAPTVENQICTKGGAEPPTKYTTENCETASSAGEWNFRGINGTEKAVTVGTLRLADTKVPIIGTVEVSCTGKGEGAVGPGKFGRVNEIVEIKCTAGENCEEFKSVKPLNLPWQTENFETEKTIRSSITAVNGKGAGWSVTCKVLGITEEDECTTEKGTVGVALKFTPGFFTGTPRWLLLATFSNLKASERAKCKVGGAESGRVLGSLAILRYTIIGGKFEDLNLF